MRQEFEVVGEQPDNQYLKTRLRTRSGFVSIFVPPAHKEETIDEVAFRARLEVKRSCMHGVNLCEVEAEVSRVVGYIVDAVATCDKLDCPFNDDGGGSGDSEPRLPVAPAGYTEDRALRQAIDLLRD